MILFLPGILLLIAVKEGTGNLPAAPAHGPGD